MQPFAGAPLALCVSEELFAAGIHRRVGLWDAGLNAHYRPMLLCPEQYAEWFAFEQAQYFIRDGPNMTSRSLGNECYGFVLKLKVVLCLINGALYFEDVCWSGGISPPCLTAALNEA
jgi:hypothetical protein